ncbi:hypothetical protein K440DRAFT_685714 [Wilcoxina mikolae CBS 423.85]|nr:hypothetical protein K440DRAFT_685714 [Wilcoxina mikolae CBS 423.85]
MSKPESRTEETEVPPSIQERPVWLAVRWFFTVASCAIICGILWAYDAKGVTKPEDKLIFNFLIQASSLALGLNLVSSLKEIAILSLPDKNTNTYAKLKKQIGSYSVSLKTLGGCKHFSGFLYLVVWVAFGVTLLRLKTRDGQWLILGLSLGVENPDIPSSMHSGLHVEQRKADIPKWEYHVYNLPPPTLYFREFSQEQNTPLSFRTERFVVVEPSCTSFPMVQGSSTSGQNQTLLVQTSATSTVDISWLDLYSNGTAWVFPISENRRHSCGPRCANIYAASFQGSANSSGSETGDTWRFFNCTVTISTMRNADPDNPLHDFPDSVASILAASIALETGGTENYSMVRYSEGVVWGNLSGNTATETANLLGRFAAGATGIMDMSNTKRVGAGSSLVVGVLLVVDWKSVGIPMGIVIFVQTILSVLTGAKLGGVSWAKTKVDEFWGLVGKKVWGDG